jgi:predicted transposase YbfD/YdcC
MELVNTEDVTVLKELHLRMNEISDPRDSAYVRHELGDIIMITLLAVLSNANEWQEIELFGKAHEKWLKRFLRLEHGIPSDDTFTITLSILDTNYVYGIAIEFLMKKLDEIVHISRIVNGTANEPDEKDIYSFDGKSSNGSGRKETDVPGAKPSHTLNAYSSDYGFCMTQIPVSEKTNEITGMPEILRMMDLRDTISTWDALNTQKDTVKTVIEGKGDYVGALKGNQHNFSQDVKDYFEPDVLDALKKNKNGYTITKEKEHSGVVTREYFLTDDIKWLYSREKWAGLKAIGMELKTIHKNNPNLPVVTEARYYISSLTDINDYSRAVRSHWGVENGLHWHLDFTFKDDKNTTMAKNGATNLQAFKKLAMAILKMAQCLYPKRTSLKSIRFRLAMSFECEIGNIFGMMNIENLRVVK